MDAIDLRWEASCHNDRPVRSWRVVLFDIVYTRFVVIVENNKPRSIRSRQPLPNTFEDRFVLEFGEALLVEDHLGYLPEADLERRFTGRVQLEDRTVGGSMPLCISNGQLCLADTTDTA